MRVLSYYGVHYRLRTRRGPAAGYRCCGCGLLAYTWAYDHKDPNEVTDDRGTTYSLDLAHYQPMCVRCHFRFDAPFKPSYQSGKRTLASPEYPTPADRELAEAAGLWPPPPPPAYHPDEETHFAGVVGPCRQRGRGVMAGIRTPRLAQGCWPSVWPIIRQRSGTIGATLTDMTEGRRSLASVITAIIAAAVLAQLGLLAPANLVVGTLAGVLVWILTAPRNAAPKG